jgi:hypothetical protein
VRRGGVLILCAVIGWGLSGCFDTGPSGPVCGAIVYEESFEGAGSGWPQSSDAESETWVEGGEYRVRLLDGYLYSYLRNEEQGPYTDFCYSGRVRDRSDGGAQSAGLAFRWTEDGRFYLFSISPDPGTVSFAIFVDGRARAIHATSCDALHGVGEENLVQVIAEGNHFLFYVNGELLLEEYDNTLSAGRIGVSAASRDTIPTVLAFDDLVVRELE